MSTTDHITAQDLADLEMLCDRISVEPTREDGLGPAEPGWWDVFMDPGGYWDTVTTATVETLQRRGEVEVFDRRTRTHFAAPRATT